MRFYALLLCLGAIQAFGDDQHWIQKQLLQMMTKEDAETEQPKQEEPEAKEENNEKPKTSSFKPSAQSIINIDYIFGAYNLFRSNPYRSRGLIC